MIMYKNDKKKIRGKKKKRAHVKWKKSSLSQKTISELCITTSTARKVFRFVTPTITLFFAFIFILENLQTGIFIIVLSVVFYAFSIKRIMTPSRLIINSDGIKDCNRDLMQPIFYSWEDIDKIIYTITFSGIDGGKYVAYIYTFKIFRKSTQAYDFIDLEDLHYNNENFIQSIRYFSKKDDILTFIDKTEKFNEH